VRHPDTLIQKKSFLNCSAVHQSVFFYNEPFSNQLYSNLDIPENNHIHWKLSVSKYFPLIRKISGCFRKNNFGEI
jgi:hypothetical protein